MPNTVNILLIEDNEADHVILRDIAENLSNNFELIWVTDGREAIDFLESGSKDPDIIFLDVNMPRMNGHDFMEAYGNTIIEKQIPVYVLTSSTHEKERALFSPYKSIVGYLIKSANYDEVAVVLSDFVDGT